MNDNDKVVNVLFKDNTRITPRDIHHFLDDRVDNYHLLTYVAIAKNPDNPEDISAGYVEVGHSVADRLMVLGSLDIGKDVVRGLFADSNGLPEHEHLDD